MSLYAGSGAPYIAVDLYKGKDITRQNAKEPGKVSLSPYLTAISLEKDIGQPAGMFELTLAYAPDGITPGGSPEGVGRSIIESPSNLVSDGLRPGDIQPGQYVEMFVKNHVNAREQYVMRGFIDNVSSSWSAGQGNTMHRSITINGRDYGALTQYFQIMYIQSLKDAQKTIFGDSLARQLQNQDNLGSMTCQQFVTDVTNLILNKNHIVSLQRQNDAIKLITPRVNIHYRYGLNFVDSQMQSFTGPIADLLAKVQAPPWGEIFIRDETAGPCLYFRIAPFLNEQGYYESLPLADKTAPYRQQHISYSTISSRDVMQENLTNSQNDLYTYFLTTSDTYNAGGDEAYSEILSKGLTDGHAIGNPYWFGASSQERINRANKFGFRALIITNPWLPLTIRGVPTSSAQDDTDSFLQVLQDMNLWLVNTMGHSEKLRSGTIAARGVNGASVGNYLYYDRTKEYFYIQGMGVEWQEGSPITTNYQLVRGTTVNYMDPFYRAGRPSRDFTDEPELASRYPSNTSFARRE